MSECFDSGEWWALPASFMNCISGFIVLQYYEVKLRLRFKKKSHIMLLDLIILIIPCEK
jgi:hypothetical protein